MVKVWSAPAETVTPPDGEMPPPGLALEVMVYEKLGELVRNTAKTDAITKTKLFCRLKILLPHRKFRMPFFLAAITSLDIFPHLIVSKIHAAETREEKIVISSYNYKER